MPKIFCIGECALSVSFDGPTAAAGLYGDIANAAAILGRRRASVHMLSEAAADPVGQAAVDALARAGADTSAIDRFTEGSTPVVVSMAPGAAPIRYERYGDECFDIVWPDITRGDIVIFGEYYALDPRMRTRMVPLLDNAAERGAAMVYLPGFMPAQAPRITRVMPAILDNLERAHIVVADAGSLQAIFGEKDSAACYERHIRYSAPILASCDVATATVHAPGGVTATAPATGGTAALAASIATALAGGTPGSTALPALTPQDAAALIQHL